MTINPMESIELDPPRPLQRRKSAFVNRFLDDIDHIEKLISANDNNKNNKNKSGSSNNNKNNKNNNNNNDDDGNDNDLTEPNQASVPVFNTLFIKGLVESEQKLHLEATIIQHVFGSMSSISSSSSSSSSSHEGFKYRINRRQEFDDVELKKIDSYRMTFRGREIPVRRFIFYVKIPLSIECEFNEFPYTAFAARATIELVSRGDVVGGKNIRFRPNLLLDTFDRRNNIVIQVPQPVRDMMHPGTKQHHEENMGRDHELQKAVVKHLDGSITYGMISPYPEVNYEYQEFLNSCFKFSVTFHLNEDAFPKFVRTHLPMLLVAALNTINCVIGVIEENAINSSETEDLVSSSDRYLQTAATVALAAVVILPEMSRRGNDNSPVAKNEFSILLIFISLIVSSIPPSFNQIVPIIGVSLLWISFGIPLYNFWLYSKFKGRLQAHQVESIKSSHTHPFVRTKDFRIPKIDDDEWFRRFCYYEPPSKVPVGSVSGHHHSTDEKRTHPNIFKY